MNPKSLELLADRYDADRRAATRAHPSVVQLAGRRFRRSARRTAPAPATSTLG